MTQPCARVPPVESYQSSSTSPSSIPASTSSFTEVTCVVREASDTGKTTTSAGSWKEVFTAAATPVAEIVFTVSRWVPSVTGLVPPSSDATWRFREPPVVGGEIDPVAVGSPDRVVGVPVEARREGAHVRAVEPDHLEVAHLVGLLGPVVAAERDVLAVRRNHRAAPGTALVGDLADRAGVQIHEVDVRLAVPEVGILRPGGVEDQPLAVRGPVEPGAVVEADRAARADVPFPFGELACRAAVSRDHEQMAVALLEESHPVLPEVHLADDPGRLRPGRALRRTRQRREVPGLRRGDHPGERDHPGVGGTSGCRAGSGRRG